ncbi:cellobiose transport system permease protein [Propionibacterium cyclohexanicum]|uniref:Cellobiose transport system permease protein n=2 Tax=Propionibacterium cyclohexanicum TaxID=64702 RepID=A0A1H9S4H8_9ACTN|nr:cellobiose transport system permease protein [Propionibacterium cyclohexanicum]
MTKRRERREHGIRRPGWLTYLVLVVAILIAVYPLYYTFLLSSSSQIEIAKHPIPGLIPQGNLLSNLTRVFHTEGLDFWGAFINSVMVAVIQSASVAIFSTLAGFAFAKLRFHGRRGLLAFIVATMAVPPQLGVVPLFIVMAKLGWTGQLVAVIVPGLVSAFGVFWMTQYLSGALPYELVEAARVDGCSMFASFRHVALPAARPAAAMLFLFTFVTSWTTYFWPSIVLGSQNPTLPVALQLLQTGYAKDMSLIMSGVLLSTLPLLVLFLVVGRQLVSGIMAGAVKG